MDWILKGLKAIWKWLVSKFTKPSIEEIGKKVGETPLWVQLRTARLGY